MDPHQSKRSLDVSELFADLTGDSSPFRDALLPVSDSQELIAREVARGLERLNMTAYTLHELSGVGLDLIMGILSGTYDLSDSLPITAIESVLKVPLRHL
ncbi:MAG: hypothetical protein RL417_97 [Pseudomonadota bacterium]|jgi:hypothetical protein